jgi:protein-S-isoprenylcysteine O-methyltransferase Ste14
MTTPGITRFAPKVVPAGPDRHDDSFGPDAGAQERIASEDLWANGRRECPRGAASSADPAEGQVIRIPHRFSRARRMTAGALVAGQLLLLAGILWLPGARAWTTPVWVVAAAVAVLVLAAGVAVAGLAGLGRGLTASPLPSPAAQLRTTGVYACVRHPIYSALLLGGAAFVILGGRLSRVWVWVALLALLLIKTRVEEVALIARFPGYRSYADKTPRLVPHPRRCRAAWRRSAQAYHRTGGRQHGQQ